MTRTIWIPEGLYRWLPRAALIAGGFTLLSCEGSLLLATCAFALFCYGVGVLTARNNHNPMQL